MKQKIIALTVVSVSFVANAQDDLVSILDSAPNTEAQVKKAEIAVQVSPLRKIVGQNLTAEQNIFFGFLESNQLAKALFQYNSAFEGSKFATTDDSKALYAWLMLKNNLAVAGVEQFLQTDAKKLNAKIIELWQNELRAQKSLFAKVNPLLWNAQWTEVLGVEAEIVVRSRQIFTKVNIEELKALIAKTNPAMPEWSTLNWQLATLMIESNATEAAQKLAQILKNNTSPIQQDLVNLTAARVLFQNGYLDASIKYYEKVPKKSELWAEAQEEIGWAYIRKGEPQNTLAISKTLTNPAVLWAAGPESLFLHALTQLKVCDYQGVMKSLQQFKAVFKARALNLDKVAKGEDIDTANAIIEKINGGAKERTALGSGIEKAPRFAFRDQVLKGAVQYQKELEKESAQAAKLYSQSLSEASASVGFQAKFEQLRKSVDLKAQEAKSTSQNRIKQLASRELDEIGKILQKMHIVEAEVIQQTSMAERLIGSSDKAKSQKAGTTGAKGRDTLTFLADDEVWFDELSNYKVDIKGACRTVK